MEKVNNDLRTMITCRKVGYSDHRGEALQCHQRGFLTAIKRVAKTIDHSLWKRIPTWTQSNMLPFWMKNIMIRRLSRSTAPIPYRLTSGRGQSQSGDASREHGASGEDDIVG